MDTSKNPAKARGSPNRVCDLVGRRFSRLLVVGHAPKRGKHHASQWACLCDCGKRITVRADNLLNGHTRSCGCLGIKHGFAHRERLYGIWKEMHRRCSNAHYKSWRLYGGKGIRVCPEWKESPPFRAWALAHGYSDSLTIDRINGNDDYRPGNCRWADRQTQANNTTRNHWVTYNGQRYTVTQLAHYLGLSRSTLQTRLSHGWTMDRIALPSRKRRR